MTDLFDVDWSQLPAPQDDGAARHLFGFRLASVPLPATSGEEIVLSEIHGRAVVYIYPMTGRPGTPLPGRWDMLPGARGCTPQACEFRDHSVELKNVGAEQLYGLSTQSTEYQSEVVERLHLPFPLLSDRALAMTNAMQLPTFEVEGMILLKRLTMIIRDGVIEHIFYPVFPPDQNAIGVINWLSENPI